MAEVLESHRLRHICTDKALIIQGFVVSGVWESALIFRGVTKLFGNRYKTFHFPPSPADRSTPPYVSPHFRCYADLKD